ncbi:MAG TPA: cadmium-translocating P-type ATPase [Lachnoclostridium sp.]|jgi:Cd2+/Zn2+-exporting ATPase|uniref:heavy metal translocating P-type ATPase n=1 Tax=Lacrimispora sp. TaxID=2719234 RepID=UPI000EEBE82D|nr:heavy metal translocating P-type ATPase [Lacrimispora sp.]HCD46567.1 cadmium-translocating P-type ATPase [Lachnoclostridium sp.]
MTKKQKQMAIRLVVSALFFAAGMLVEEKTAWYWMLFLISYLAAGYDIPLRALRNIRNGQIFDENFLMSVATFGAIGIGALEEAVGVMLFYQVGELFNDYAVNKSRKSITQLMDINPEYANLLKDGKEEKVDPYEVSVGDRIVIKPGEKVPLDGIVVKGTGGLDTKALTGESMPVEVKENDAILSGSINLNGVLEVEVTKLFDDSTVAKILELVENASFRKAKAENFITRFAKIYTPVVVSLALILAVVPPLVFGGEWGTWIYRACSFLVVSCPCALVISVPLSFFGGLGAASRHGILMKGSNYLEAMASLDTVVFDKTGTLTTGKFRVTDVDPVEGTKEELLKLAAHGEFHSNHPIALSVKEAYGKPVEESFIGSVEEIAGYGVRAELKDGEREHELYIGNARLMEQQGITITDQGPVTGTSLYVADGGRYLGSITISDTIREDVPMALKGLKAAGVRKLVMLTGDKPEVGQAVGEKLGLDEVHGGLLPGDKVGKLEELLSKKQEGMNLAFVGDGINDAPVLARADVGIAMGGIGSDAAVEAADVVIMTDEPSKLIDAIAIARKTARIVKQNIIFAIGVKVLILLLSAAGLATMWAAVFGDVGVSVLAILNAIRALAYQSNK